MVKQGDIIKLNLDPTVGHEQAGYRPALVVSNETFREASNMTFVCPITHTNRHSLLHVKLTNIKTDGFVMCDQLRSVDLTNRKFTIVDHITEDIAENVAYVIAKSVKI
jgi:mRNA interferase MazF